MYILHVLYLMISYLPFNDWFPLYGSLNVWIIWINIIIYVLFLVFTKKIAFNDFNITRLSLTDHFGIHLHSVEDPDPFC